jgi:hypothetical protein
MTDDDAHALGVPYLDPKTHDDAARETIVLVRVL